MTASNITPLSGSTRILITGGAGFIGSRLAVKLVAAGHECTVLDNLSVGLAPPEARDGMAFHKIDVCDRDEVTRAFADYKPSTLVHLAATHHIPTCEHNAPEALRNNIVGFQVVLDAAQRCGLNTVLLASSGAVYDWNAGPLDEDTTAVRPSDVYSLSKHTNELQVRLWATRTGGRALVARIFNTIGPGDPNGHLIPDIVRQLRHLSRRGVVRIGNTHTFRDYIHVDDTAAGLNAIIDSSLPSGLHTFNIGTGTESSVLTIVSTIARLMKVDYEVAVDPDKLRATDRPSQLANVNKALRILGWKAHYTLNEALTQTLA